MDKRLIKAGREDDTRTKWSTGQEFDKGHNLLHWYTPSYISRLFIPYHVLSSFFSVTRLSIL